MSEDGIYKVKEGITSVTELSRVLYVFDNESVSMCPGCSSRVRTDFLTCLYCRYNHVNECPTCG